MSKVKKIVGRRNITSTTTTLSNDIKTIQLASGTEIDLTAYTVPHASIESETFVNETINGRFQDNLSAENLKDITETIKTNQYYPVIARKIGDRFDILDGSRRRQSAILTGVNLEMLYTENDISEEDAMMLSEQLQTAKELSIAEQGAKYLRMMERLNIDGKRLAQKIGVSAAKISRCTRAASVSRPLLSIFPDINELSVRDYVELAKVNELLVKSGDPIEEFCATYKQQTQEQDLTDTKSILKTLSDSFKSAKAPSAKLASPIFEFKQKGLAANKIEKGNKLSFEFNKLPNETKEKIEAAILSVLQEQHSD
ncbi:hypothetical protein C2869_21975 (plasmid) [Saccharobesus litoralis]|uniref:ParB-like N-terminal domain-containing protein n=1 Tax=Saccharobesus litoralis TaxID=2172099 RepID=A0A2S0VYA0_9ALTE|nr:ParB/RepB/Spo0J family partition protein [Saccharobesus litoralis]AWB69173.1 hypothetical protein C2869_21975 [Saccharobesus litoralis]